LCADVFWVISFRVKFCERVLGYTLFAASICLAPAICAASSSQNAPSSPPPEKPFVVDRTTLPPVLHDVDLRHLSSGALMLFNKNNNLVRPHAASSAQGITTNSTSIEAQSIALDPRVGANLRLGDDPAALPPDMRAQAEPHISRSPVNPDFLAAVFQEGRFTDGGAVDCGYSITHDGGLTWSRALIPGVTQITGGPYFRDTDPVAGIDLNGNIYLNTDAATDPNFNTGQVVISKSTDGGLTFAPPVVVYAPPSSSVFPDKNWMTINTFSGTPTAGRIVVTFTRFSGNVSPIVRAISDDGGASWSNIAFVHSSTSNAQGSQPVFLPNGNLVIVYWVFSSPEHMEAVISTDGGVTFGTPKFITNATEWNEPSIRTGSFLPSAAADRTSANLYIVYQTLFFGIPRIAFTKSTDGGNTWSAPIAISDTPGGLGVFNPAVNVSPDGQTVTATFYDHRNNPSSTVLVDLYLAQSFDGGATWQPNIRLTSTSTDASLAPLTSEGYMLGDYLGVAPTTEPRVPAVPVWIDTRTGNPDPFITRVGIAPQLDLTSWEAARLSLGEFNDPALRTAEQLNISTRLDVSTGDNVGIGGFIITGTDPKKVILRAIGPSLTAAGVPGALQDPTLELHDNTGAVIAFDDNWKDSQQSEIQATGIAPTDDRESAILQTLMPGAYTAIVRGGGNTTGVGLVEAYDLDQTANSKLANISTRGFVEAGDNIMIGGLIVGGGNGPDSAASEKVVVRGIGPSLTQSGVTNALQDPTLELHDGNGTLFASNDNWKDTQQADIQATGLAPTDDRESAILAIVIQGNYTAILRGKNNTTGVALVEAYNIP
jgi:hypothetical protein